MFPPGAASLLPPYLDYCNALGETAFKNNVEATAHTECSSQIAGGWNLLFQDRIYFAMLHPV